MKIVLIFRKRHVNAYSIEELFHSVAGELKKNNEITEYVAGSRWNIVRDAWRLRKMKADIYHLTGDIHYLILLLPRRKTILTIHDIGHFLFGLNGIKRWLYKWLWLVLPIRAARAVTAVSKATSDNIVTHLGLADKPVEVIENCHHPIFKPVHRPFNVNQPAILQVGTKSYKNVPRLIEALQGIPCRLVLVGSLDDEIRNKLADCNVAYENHVGLTHAEIYKQYVKSDLVSFVSLGEGFGVPIIEAQATGRPLITANVSPMCDVAGEGACLADPMNVSQIREGIQKIIADEDYRKRLIERGLHNVRRYSPVAISSQYYTLYQRIG